MRSGTFLPILLGLAVASGAGCTEKTTPTEVPAYVAPTPLPTPLPQPASMAGIVRYWGGAPNVGATVECQGKSTISLDKGAYEISGLMSGATTVSARWQEAGTPTTQDFTVLLKPGPNPVDLTTGP